MSRLVTWCCMASWWLLLGSFAPARMPAPVWVPIDRLLANADTYIASHPGDAVASYTRGRIHHLAFLRGHSDLPQGGISRSDERVGLPDVPEDPLTASGRAGELLLYKEAQRRALRELGLPPTTAEIPDRLAARFRKLTEQYEFLLRRERWQPPVTDIGWPERLDHYERAVKDYREAMRLKPKVALYPLSLGSLVEEFNGAVRRDAAPQLPETLPQFSGQDIRDFYWKSFELAAPLGHNWQVILLRAQMGPQELTKVIEGLGPDYRFDIYPEAGRNFVRVATQGNAVLSDKEKQALEVAKAGLLSRKKFDDASPQLISPILFSLEPVTGIVDLLDSQADVGFDLAGSGGTRRWPWVRPHAGFLVWDPDGTARIESARQMFGTYTFAIPWENGYRALAALDDNADGFLTGAELQGIAVWFDADGDARSTPEEVIPLTQLGIQKVAAYEVGCEGPHPMNPGGLQLNDGSWLPTWDWMTQAHPSKPSAFRK